MGGWKIIKEGEKFYYNAEKRHNSIEKCKIIYLESKAHVILIHKENNEEEKFRGKLGDAGEQLLKSEFLRIGKSYIINLNKIKAVNKREVSMDDGTKIMMSRNYKNEAMRRYGEFIERKLRYDQIRIH